MKRLGLGADAIPKARALRRNITDAERVLWRALREALPDCHWRKQVPLGRYFADFASHSAKLIVEVDGGQHSSAATYDAERTAFLEAEGYRVVRFWNHDVLSNVDGVVQIVAEALPPSGGGASKARHAGVHAVFDAGGGPAARATETTQP